MSTEASIAAETAIMEMVDAGVGSTHIADLTVIERVQWTVRRGEYWVVGGLPSSGKSDLLITAAGLMPPLTGTVRLFDHQLTRLPEEDRLRTQLRVGVVFGNGGRLFSHLSVAENLALPLCYHHNCTPDASDERVHAMLELLQLTEVAAQTPALISRTLRQRVALARALMLSPELLLLDNPLVGLDPRESRWLLDFLNRLRGKEAPWSRGQRLTLVASTDDLEPWCDQGTHFAIISGARFVPVGGRPELVNASTPGLRELLPVDWLEE